MTMHQTKEEQVQVTTAKDIMSQIPAQKWYSKEVRNERVEKVDQRLESRR